MKRIKPVTGEIYHIFNRGVEKRKIFLQDADRLRFVHDLWLFNNESAVFNAGRHLNQSPIEVRLQSKRKEMVKIMAFVLMDNHYHLMVKQVAENGITEFMRKLGTGYSNYFNLKYQRVGPLFQGKYKSIIIKSDSHFLFLPYYIHLNPLDNIIPEWRSQKIKNLKKAMEFLESYRWSSHLDYLGKKNFPDVINNSLLKAFFESPTWYKRELLQWLQGGNINEILDIALEPID